MRSIGRLFFYFGSLCLVCYLTMTQVSSQAPQATPATGQNRSQTKSGAINGRVLAEDGRAIEGVAVFCASLDGSSSSRNALTDADGQFTFSGLPQSAYRISASHAGFVVDTSGAMDRIARIGDTLTVNLTKGGVITGRVTDSSGAPVVAVPVSAYRIKDPNGRPVQVVSAAGSRQTDDRGIYRIFGLTAGSYHVVANPREYLMGLATAYDFEIPSYHPASDRDSASEVMLQQGMEVTSIDIRYRDARGHAISGTIDAGAQTNSSNFSISVRAISTQGSMPSGATFSGLVEGVRVFTMNGIPDGDYDLVARGSAFNTSVEETYSGPPRKVTVRGGDVSGVKLTIAPGVSIAGQVGIEVESRRPEICPPARESSLRETVIKAQRDEKTSEPDSYGFPATRSGVVNDKGEFVVRNLKAAPYRFLADLPTDLWYVKTITMSAATGTRRTDLGRNPLATRSGDKISNVAIILGEGAAGLRGKLSAARTRLGLWRLYLVPVEIGQADNALVHYESNSGPDGGFTFANIAPGKYWIVARPAPEEETPGTLVRPVAWDATERAKLRGEAEAAKNVVDLKSCQRLKDYVLD